MDYQDLVLPASETPEERRVRQESSHKVLRELREFIQQEEREGREIILTGYAGSL